MKYAVLVALLALSGIAAAHTVTFNFAVNVDGTTEVTSSSTDTADTDFTDGTLTNFTTEGTGATANLTSTQNTSGVFASGIFDAGSSANWTSITTASEAAYGIETGRALNDGTSGTLPAINPTGIVLLLFFNNESSYGENDTNAADFSPFGNNGTLQSGAHYNFTDRILGGASMSFDGVDDYVKITDAPSLQITADITTAAWVIKTGVRGIVVSKQSTTVGIWNYVFYTSLTNKVLWYDNNNPSGYSSTASIPEGVWTHIAFTRSGTTGKFYINGALDSTHSIPNAFPNNADYHLYMAVYQRDTNHKLNGSMDEVAIFNRSLSADEIRNIYLRGAFRFNITVNSCSASDCSSGTSVQVTNPGNQSVISLTGLPQNRYFQYTINYTNSTSVNTTNNDKIRINSVTITKTTNSSSSNTIRANDTDFGATPSSLTFTDLTKKYLLANNTTSMAGIASAGILLSARVNTSYNSTHYLLQMTQDCESSRILLFATNGSYTDVEDNLDMIEQTRMVSSTFGRFVAGVPKTFPTFIRLEYRSEER